jgi:beta-galactosidase
LHTHSQYKGEPAYPKNINSQFGILDIAGFPKDSYYWFKSNWQKKTPVLHLLPHWTWNETDSDSTGGTAAGGAGLHKLVRAYTNAASVSLALNGKVIGSKQSVPKLGWAEWNVSYVPGVLTAKGYDAAGKVIATDLVQTAGKPARLRLSVESTELGGMAPSPVLEADGIDVGAQYTCGNGFLIFSVISFHENDHLPRQARDTPDKC